MHETERPPHEFVNTAADVSFVCSVVYMVASLPELRSLLPEAQIPKLAAIAKKKKGEVSGERV